MIDEDLVADANICKYLKEHGWTAPTKYQWRKYSLNKGHTLAPNDDDTLTKLLIASGTEEYRLPAPTIRELIDALPTVTIDHSDSSLYKVYCNYSPDSSDYRMFKIDERLENALADLWTQMSKEGLV